MIYIHRLIAEAFIPNPFNLPHIVPPLKFCEVAISKKKVFEILLKISLGIRKLGDVNGALDM